MSKQTEMNLEEMAPALSEGTQLSTVSESERRTELVQQQAQSPAAIIGILQAAVEKGIDPESLEKLVALQERVMDREAESAFNQAFHEFQTICPMIPKRSEADTGKYKYKYAKLETIACVIRESLDATGLSYSFDQTYVDRVITVVCTVSHVRGYSKTTPFSAPIDDNAKMNSTQKFASATSYCKRYALAGALGLTLGDDNDANFPAPDKQPDAPTARPRADRVTSDELMSLSGKWRDYQVAREAEPTRDLWAAYINAAAPNMIERSFVCGKAETWKREIYNAVRDKLDADFPVGD